MTYLVLGRLPAAQDYTLLQTVEADAPDEAILGARNFCAVEAGRAAKVALVLADVASTAQVIVRRVDR